MIVKARGSRSNRTSRTIGRNRCCSCSTKTFLHTNTTPVPLFVTTAIFLSFTFLLPVFMICGPQGQQGDLRALFRGNLAGFIGCGGHKKLAPVPAPPAAVAAAAE